MPSRTPLAALAVASTTVRPILATTAPCDCWASLPVSKVMVLSVPEIGPRHGDGVSHGSCLLLVSELRRGRFPDGAVRPGDLPGSRQLAADLPVAAPWLWQRAPSGPPWFVPG